MSRGIDRERQVVKRLEEQGWWAKRMPGSFGTFDIVAIRAFPYHGHAKLVRLIEVKSTKAGPYAGFGPDKRQLLKEEASAIKAEALLCWWPPRQEPKWIPAKDWPS